MSEKRRCEDCIHHDPCERIYRYYFNMAIPDYKPKSCPCYKQSEVAREIFAEIDKILDLHTDEGYYLNGEWNPERLDTGTRDAIAELKKKYTEGSCEE